MGSPRAAADLAERQSHRAAYRRVFLSVHWIYPATPSVVAGETLEFRTRTEAERCRLVVTRVGASQDFAGERSCTPARGSRWTSVGLAVPRDARPGAYIVRVVGDEDTDARLVDSRSGAAFFVVRPRRATARIVVNVPVFTYHAYNCGDVDPIANETTGDSLYTGAKRVELHRPGGGVGGHLWDECNVDAHDVTSPRQSFAHWDARALAFLERAGYDAECVTDYDLHVDPSALEGRRLLLCFGHHEYWTDAMRARAEALVAAGGSVAFFGANALWFRTRFDAETMSIGRAGAWPVGEERFTGASYRYGGGKWIGERPALGYTVAAADHWAFAGCGFVRGSTFGAAGRLIGYECDGIPDGAPDDGAAEIARAELGAWDVADGSGEVFPGGHASFVVRRGAGTVVHAGTVDWPRLLDDDAAVTRITHNVIARLGAA